MFVAPLIGCGQCQIKIQTRVIECIQLPMSYQSSCDLDMAIDGGKDSLSWQLHIIIKL